MRYLMVLLLSVGVVMAQENLVTVGQGFLAANRPDDARTMFYKALFYDPKNSQALWELAKLDNDGDLGFKAFCLSDSKTRKSMILTLSKINSTCAKVASAYEEYDASLLKLVQGNAVNAELVRPKLKLRHEDVEWPFNVEGTYVLYYSGSKTNWKGMPETWKLASGKLHVLNDNSEGAYDWDGKVLTIKRADINEKFELKDGKLVLTVYQSKPYKDSVHMIKE